LTGCGPACRQASSAGGVGKTLLAGRQVGLPTSRPAFCFLASLVLAGAKTKPNFFTSPKVFPFRYEIPDYDMLLVFGFFLPEAKKVAPGPRQKSK